MLPDLIRIHALNVRCELYYNISIRYSLYQTAVIRIIASCVMCRISSIKSHYGPVIQHAYTSQTVAFKDNQMGVVDMAETNDSISSEERSE